MTKLLLFAAAREAAGCRELELEAGTVGEALAMATDRLGPGFERLLPRCAVFVDEDAVPPGRMWETSVGEGTEVAILPPVSGGAHGDHDDGAVVTTAVRPPAAESRPPLRVAVLTVSDRAARGETPDRSGPAVERLVAGAGWKLIATATVPDEVETIRSALCAWSDDGVADLVLTTGGTGLGPRDVTPEATRAVLEREVPGIPEVMRRVGMASTPLAALSRQVAGQRGRTLIVNLPGSPRAAGECLESILALLPHAVELVREWPVP